MTINKIYRVERKNSLAVLKWLRSQCNRGDAWDFSGGPNSLDLTFKDDKLELAYIMKWEWTKA